MSHERIDSMLSCRLNFSRSQWSQKINQSDRQSHVKSKDSSYLSCFVQFIVGEFHLFKRYDLLLQRVGSNGCVRVGVETRRRWWISFACDQPRGSVICIAIASGVDRNNIYKDSISIGWLRTQWTWERYSNCREHSSESREEKKNEFNLSRWLDEEYIAHNSWEKIFLFHWNLFSCLHTIFVSATAEKKAQRLSFLTASNFFFLIL